MFDMRRMISEGNDWDMLVASDMMEDNNTDDSRRLSELLRAYVDIQTYVRTSQPIPANLVHAFEQLNNAYKMDMRQYLPGYYRNAFSKPLGPFYTMLQTTQVDLANNLDWLSQNPIRDLEIYDVTPNNDLQMILRNYRVNVAYRITLHMSSRRSDVQVMSKAIRDMMGGQLLSLTINNLNDRLKIVQMGFKMAQSVARGAVLYIGGQRVTVR